jgi:CBS domain-containing protein
MAISFSCLMNGVLWFLIWKRKRREELNKNEKRDAEKRARKSPEEAIHRKRKQILRLLDEGFSDFVDDRITVRAIITQEVTVCRTSNSANVIYEKMVEEQLRNVWVCDEENRLAGVLTRSDIPPGANASVLSFMTPNPVAVRPDARLSECINAFVQNGVSTLPVAAKDGSICGVVLVLDALLLLQVTQMSLNQHRDQLSKTFFCRRDSTSISDLIASTIQENTAAVQETITAS